MNFFDAQDRARRATRALVFVYVIATILIVAGITLVVGAAIFTLSDGSTAPPAFLAGTAVLATLLIVGSTLYKTARLSAGGGRVAQDMGGSLVAPDVQDPLRRRLRNVVEEMAIASSVPVPEIYVLEEEHGINAFAAGFSPGDAAIAVTRGCLDLLSRDELQGVIAHEFSHILNGDMRLNIRMMGVLFGIMVLGLIGRLILRSSYHNSSFSSRRDRNAPAILLIGAGLVLLGWIGVFFARLIKASVSRQREALADASAVQFTRQTDGLANALKKIGGYSNRSYIRRADPEEVSHMLFAAGAKRLSSLFATHPPLAERIRALDPGFSERDYPTIDVREIRLADEPDQAVGLAPVAAPADGSARGLSDTIADTVGNPLPEHIVTARKLRSSIPAELYQSAHSPDGALLLAIALAIGDDRDDTATASRQLRLVRERLGRQRAALVETYYRQILEAGAEYRLALLEISFPLLRNRPAPQLEFLIEMVNALVQMDGRVSLSEYCYFRVLKCHLGQAINPRAAQSRNRVGKRRAQSAAKTLVRIIAEQGNDDPQAQSHARDAGLQLFGSWVDDAADGGGETTTIDLLEQTLDTLSGLNSAGKQTLLRAVTETIAHDGRLSLAEAELLRTICASLNCPLPPLIESRYISPARVPLRPFASPG